jgi:hypothetical protein
MTIPYGAITASQLLITRCIIIHDIHDNSPNDQCSPIELLLREDSKERVNMDPIFIIVVLASHDERTH